MKAFIYGPKFMYNLDSSVGKGASNGDRTDVSFIQWYYVLARDFSLTTPAAKAIYQNVTITGVCNGQDGDPLVKAILSQQRETNHSTIDGKVSVVSGSGKVGQNAFFVLRMQARLAVMYPDQWPRLDKIPKCPSLVAAVALAAVPNMAELMGS